MGFGHPAGHVADETDGDDDADRAADGVGAGDVAHHLPGHRETSEEDEHRGGLG